MGFFDSVREKAAELMSGATDKVSELTGAELPNTEAAADTAVDSVHNAGDAAATEVTSAATDVTGAVDGVTGAATDTVGDVTGAASDVVEPYRP